MLDRLIRGFRLWRWECRNRARLDGATIRHRRWMLRYGREHPEMARRIWELERERAAITGECND